MDQAPYPQIVNILSKYFELMSVDRKYGTSFIIRFSNHHTAKISANQTGTMFINIQRNMVRHSTMYIYKDKSTSIMTISVNNDSKFFIDMGHYEAIYMCISDMLDADKETTIKWKTVIGEIIALMEQLKATEFIQSVVGKEDGEIVEKPIEVPKREVTTVRLARYRSRSRDKRSPVRRERSRSRDRRSRSPVRRDRSLVRRERSPKSPRELLPCERCLELARSMNVSIHVTRPRPFLY